MGIIFESHLEPDKIQSKKFDIVGSYYNPNEHYIYNRIGYRYRLRSGLVISLIGKTQLFKIQFTELGIGYSF